MFTDETDEDILVIISIKDDKESSNHAFNEFHRRFKHFIYGMATKVTASLANSQELRDAVFQNTLIDVFKYCHSFSSHGETDPEKVRKRIHGWLVKIAERQLKSLLTGREIIMEAENLSSSKFNSIDDNLEVKPNEEELYNKKVLSNALKLLNDRDQHIFITYWMYYEPGKESQAKNLPSEVLKNLVAKYETSAANIRKIISRSKQKVFAYLEENYRLKKNNYG